jgi:FkbM family methyltransferase
MKRLSNLIGNQHLNHIRNMGMLRWIVNIVCSRSHAIQRIIGHRIWPKDSKFPLIYRPGSSDMDVLQQIYVDLEYQCLDHLQKPKLIIDCGANVGYSSTYFLSRFPSAKVIAIEPEPGNYAILARNVALFGTRVTAIQAAVWSSNRLLKVRREGFGDEREWAFWVSECEEGEVGDVQGVTIPSLIERWGANGVSILKVDIEGAEALLFNDDAREWISKCESIVIELHGPECEKAFLESIRRLPFDISRSGELTVCLRRAPEA